jgi:type VI secretion system protein ImpA
MLLVRQAQQLVGKSFIEAMRTLNPDIARNAAIRIGGAMPLIIDADQMTELASREDGAAEETPETPVISVASRGEASAIMESIEKFYQRTEPSSPIPLLLNRARSYAGKDFATLLKEIGPSDD